MKKYILKLIQQDIDLIEHRIRSWHKSLPNQTNLEYASKQYNALQNNLNRAVKYKKMIENTL